MKLGKRFRSATETVGAEKLSDLNVAVEKLKASATAKFDETIEVAMRLGGSPRRPAGSRHGGSAARAGKRSVLVL
jgi:large subunit ribosomal protein L1